MIGTITDFCSTEIKGENATLNEVYVIEKSFRTSHSRKLHREIIFKFYDLRKFKYVNFSIFTIPQLNKFRESVDS